MKSPRALTILGTLVALLIAEAAMRSLHAPPLVHIIALVSVGVFFAILRGRFRLGAALLVTVLTVAVAGATTLFTLATSIDQAHSQGYIKVQLWDDAGPAETAGMSQVGNPQSRNSPAIKKFFARLGGPDLPGNASLAVAVDKTSTSFIWNSSRRARILYVISSTLPYALITLTALMILLILRRSRSGDPFAPANARTLEIAGWILMLGMPIQQLLVFATTELTAPRFFIQNDAPTYNPNPFTLDSLLPGLALLVLAHIWREGARLRDVEQTTI